MPTVRKRSVQIKITLTPELHANLAEVARQLGQAPATLCSVWIGQNVAQLGRSLGAADRAVDEMVKQAGPALTEQIRLMGSSK